ncbi:MAG: alpha/beta fold hydrolase [Candidatus Lokiarchaeota archaeon]|nr:alpha/beta fold hydrolase [Candidatus Lokiarchaeota archaeon]
MCDYFGNTMIGNICSFHQAIPMFTLQLEEHHISYRKSGTGDPLLLVHGLGGDNTSWEFTEPYLSKNFELILPDLRCHGASGCTEGTPPPSDFAEDMIRLVEYLEIAPIPVVGTSLGGMVVQQMILERPDLFSHAVLIDTTPRVDERLVDMVYAWREAQIDEGDKAYWWTATKDTLTPRFIEENPDTLDYLLNKFLSSENEANILSAIGFATFDAVNLLQSVTIPVLVIHGEIDQLIILEDGKLLHKSIPGSRLEIIAGCGHSPDIEVPEKLSSLITSFVKNEGA